MLRKASVWGLLVVYTKRQSVQDFTSTGPLVNLIDYHKGRFKAKSYLSLYRRDPLCSLFLSLRCLTLLSLNFIQVGDCWIKIRLWPCLRSNKSGTHLECEWGLRRFVFSSMSIWNLDIYMSKNIVGWMRNCCSNVTHYKMLLKCKRTHNMLCPTLETWKEFHVYL